MSDHLLKAHLKFMLFIPAVMLCSILYQVFSPEVCRKTGEAATDEFLFKKAYSVVFPDSDDKEIQVEYAGWYFSRKVFVSGGSATLELDDDIEYLIWDGYYEIFFRDPDIDNYSLTLDACGRPQDDSQWLEVLIDDAKDLKK